jgi:hypothetical protein
MTSTAERDRRRAMVKLHLSNEHLVAIGHVAVRSAVLDAQIETAFETMARAYPSTVKRRVDSLSQDQKLEVIKETLSRDLERHKYVIADFIAEVAAARDERHAIIHSIWGKTDTDEAKTLLDYRVWKSTRPVKRVTSKSMMALATQMIDLGFELSDWVNLRTAVHYNRRPASRGISLPPTPLPIPPRASDLDYEERLRRRGSQPDTSEC